MSAIPPLFAASIRTVFGGGRMCLAVVFLLGLNLASVGRAQAPAATPVSDMEAVAIAYNAAIEAFTAGKWDEAASGFEAAMKLILDDRLPQLPPLMYMAGAAHFNAGSNEKAIEHFKKYITKFPNSEKLWDVKLGLARATLRAKKYDEAIPLFKELEAAPAWRDEALLSQALAYRSTSKIDEAIATLVRLITPDIRTVAQAGGGVTLAELYGEKKEPKKAVIVLQRLEAKPALVENPVGLNAVAIRLGDEFLEDKVYADALAAYRTVRSREDVIKIQTYRVNRVTAAMEANTKAAAGNPQLAAQVEMLNTQLKEQLAEAKQQYDEFQKQPDFGPALLLRMARAYYEWEKRWEAVVVYERLLAKYPPGVKDREGALFGRVIAFNDLLQMRRCQAACDDYLKEFPEAQGVGTVGFMSGAVAMAVQDYVGAEAAFVKMLEKVPNSEFKQEMRYMLGNARFMQGKFDEAVKDYARYQADYPNGERFDEVSYRIGLCAVFTSDYVKGKALLSDFVAKIPHGPYTGDARYRLMICEYAAMNYEAVIAAAEPWLVAYPGHDQEAEVLALLGDSQAAVGKLEEAITAYTRCYKIAKTDEVLSHGLFEASKHLQKLGKWPEVAAMFEEFVKDRPDHVAVITAMFWIAKARAKQGQTEEAKAFLVTNLKKYIAEPKREAVEPLLLQLAQLCSKRPRPKTPPPPPATPPPAPAPAVKGAPPTPPPTPPPPPPPLPPYDAPAELAKQVRPLEADANVTTKARLLYAQSELARLLRKPEQADEIYLEMATRFKPSDLSPYLLAQVGDFMNARGDREKATLLFTELKDRFPNSDYLDYAYVGLGEIALAKKEYEKALELFTEALDKIGASSKSKEGTIGKAHTLLALKRHDEAKKLFGQVAAVKEWRGETTAMAVYMQGQTEADQGRYAEAIAFYRRVFVAYQKYLPWVAKSYIGAADCFVKMGKRGDAIENFREMLRNEKLANLPEAEEARRLLREWGVSS